MSFNESRISDGIAYGSTGGPRYKTVIITLDSGYQTRDSKWSYPLYAYNVGYGVKTLADMYELQELFHASKGSANGFRFKDFADFKSCAVDQTLSFNDQSIGTGDGATTAFQLSKTYTFGAVSQSRIISKPVSGTTVIAIDGVEQTSGWTIDTTTGIVTFTTAPLSAEVITAGFEFDVPVHFSSDEWSWSWENFESLSANVGLMEVRL